VEDVAHYDLTGIVSEFRKHVFRELDFSLEARNLNRFREHFRDVPEIVFPKVFSDLSTERVLAMEMIEGVNVRNIDLLRQKGFDCRSLALAGARAILKQVFEDGFFHADPHPGNLFILSDGRIAFIDAGMAARLDEETMGQLASLLYSIVKKDLHGIWRELVSMDVLDEFQDTRPLRLDLMDFIDHYVDRPLKEISAQKLLSEFTEIISKHHLQIPADMTLLIKCLITIEGIGRNLDPDFNLAEHATPYVEKWLRHRYSPSRMFKHFRNTFTDFLHLVKVFPRETRSILSQIRKGSLKIEFEHLGLDPALKVFSEISRRLSLALLLASLIIGSSLIVLSGIPPVWHGVPVIGIAGFLVSGILAVYLFFML
jgi:ubiquinone biosynthesis protein